MHNEQHTYIISWAGPRLVAVATGGFTCVFEQKVNDVHPIVHLKQTVMVVKLKCFSVFQKIKRFSQYYPISPGCQKLAQSHTSLVSDKLAFTFAFFKATLSWHALMLNHSLTQKASTAPSDLTLSVVSVIILTLKQLVEFQRKSPSGIQMQHTARLVRSLCL